MTVKQLTQIERYVGPSTATKPLDCSVGSTFLEEDTSRLFVFDGTGWFPKTQDIVIYDAEGNPLGIEGGRMKVSVDASVLRDGSDPDNKLAILPDGSLKAQLSGTIEAQANEMVREVVETIGREHILSFLPLRDDPGSENTSDLFNSDIIFEKHGDVTFGDSGLLGNSPLFNGGGLRQKAIAENTSATSVIGMTSPSHKLATKLPPLANILSHFTFMVKRVGSLSDATLKISIYNDNNGVPGGEARSFYMSDRTDNNELTISCADIATGQTVRGFTLPTPLELRSILRYWIVIEYADGTGVDANNYIELQSRTSSVDLPGQARGIYDGNAWSVFENSALYYSAYSNALNLPGDWSIITGFRDLEGLISTPRYVYSTSGTGENFINSLLFSENLRMGTSVTLEDGTNITGFNIKSPFGWQVAVTTFSAEEAYDKLRLYMNGKHVSVGSNTGRFVGGTGATPVYPIAFPWQLGGSLGSTNAFSRQWKGNIGPFIVVNKKLEPDEVRKVSNTLLRLVTDREVV
jgi:hypothetical protein